MRLENTWQEIRDHSFTQNHSRSFRFPALWLCFFSSVHLTHFLQGSGQRTGMAIAEAWFCTQWPVFLFLRFVFGLLSVWKIQTWPIVRFLTVSDLLISYLLVFDRINGAMFQNKMSRTSSRNIGPQHQKHSSIFYCTHGVLFLSLCSPNPSWMFAHLKNSAAGVALRTILKRSDFHNPNIFNAKNKYVAALLNPHKMKFMQKTLFYGYIYMIALLCFGSVLLDYTLTLQRSNWQFISVNLVSSPCILLNFKSRKGFSTNCIKEFNTCEIYTASEKSAAVFDNNGLFSSTQALVSSVVLGVLFWIMVLHTQLSFAAHQKYILHIFYSLWWWLRKFGLCFPSYLYFCETGSHGWRVACS